MHVLVSNVEVRVIIKQIIMYNMYIFLLVNGVYCAKNTLHIFRNKRKKKKKKGGKMKLP